MTSPLLSVKQLSIENSERVLFQDVHFDVYPGEMLAVMGPSGIGKSMLTKAIAGFTPDSLLVSGDIKLADSNVCNLPLLKRTANQRPAFIFQDALQALNPLVSVQSQLCLALTSCRTKPTKKNKSTIRQLLTQLGFHQPEQILSLFPSQLSGGQRQRICIAMGLLSDAKVLIADEPTSALDPVTEQEILLLIHQNVKHHNMAGVLITHDLHSALQCDKLLVLDEGRAIAYGQPKEVIQSSTHEFCRSLQALIQ
ncbi:ABC transporter ATP-binding protein [Vibrio sp. 10N.286.49.C2]|uniref:ATP-binding cassette domain-containing protein n=1 Tax=unclassified Vibrio TaxID=2614977 RepID=UPI000C8602B8|nr:MULTISPECIES: ATP-binding cassette domain-containing protein [unclassified Vibrio]PMH42772.1 ABC transporter ATP-binding protein [Vibrio sp. 10N.286.49.C2]PMH53890.1 ABC transporter ATP-binding protein [Vibrio sp. 10N.286.49.B1]PMH79483.1 ABC transporter ATP-binding protein [Vibrio sp. 10N.286.48.B7]